MTSLADRKCNKCGEVKPLTSFYRNRTKSGGRGYTCAACERLHHATRDAGLHRRIALLKRYGLTLEQYQSMSDAQGGACMICKRTDVETLVVDHDHSCCSGRKTCGKCVRGLLCPVCNQVLGMMKDSPEMLEEAARYLRTASSKE